MTLSKELENLIASSNAHYDLLGNEELELKPNRPQTIHDHSLGLYLYASEFIRSFNWPREQTALLDRILFDLAKLHDLGKYNPEWQFYLMKSVAGATFKEKLELRRDHKTLGALILQQKIKAPSIAYILSQVLHAHHSGLSNRAPDAHGTHAWNIFQQEPEITFHEKCNKFNFEYYNFDFEPLVQDINFEQLEENTKQFYSFLVASTRDKGDVCWSAQFMIRLLHSLVCDGDFIDTEEFYSPDQTSSRGTGEKLGVLYQKLLEYTTTKFQKTKNKSRLNKYRVEIYEQCTKQGWDFEQSKGFFLLEAPTGSGKTLSSMAFSLSHGMKHNKQRVIIVLPFVSIIEQNSNVYKEVFGRQNVLEHHGNITLSADTNILNDALHYRNKGNNIDVDNWDSPIVVTTMVQFIETLFASSVSKNRKIHNIVNSVIIFDEAQSLPLPLLNPIIKVLDELVRNYNCSVVLSSATVPTFDIPDPIDLIKKIDVEKYYNFFEGRQNIHIDIDNEIEITQLADTISTNKQCLCVVNLRKTAQDLYKLLKVRNVPNLFHLSTLMIPKDKKEVIRKVAELLNDGIPCTLVSTTVIEAGVDVDFPVVYREQSGVGNYVQTMGRCNRHFYLEKGDFHIFKLKDIKIPGFLSLSADLANTYLRLHGSHFKDFDNMKSYFTTWLDTKKDKLDTDNIIYMLTNISRFQFKTVSSVAKVIKQITIGIIVLPENEIQEILMKENKRQAAILLGQHSVQVYQQDYKKMYDIGLIKVDTENEIAFLSDLDKYSPEIGLDMSQCDDETPDKEYY